MDKGSLEKVEVLAVGLSDMLSCFSEKVRAVTQEVMGDGQHLSVEEIRERVQIVQEEVYRETVQKYNDFLGTTAEAERDLVLKIHHLRELKARAAILKELIASLVKPDGAHPQGEK